MKKLGKILIITICVFLAMCQINTKVYSYSQDKLKEMLNYQVITDDTDLEFDIPINGEYLKRNAELPNIRTSVESIMYDKDRQGIDFLGNDVEDRDDAWLFIRKWVRNLYKMFLYIALAMMLTLLIYIGVSMVSSAISEKGGFLALGKVFSGKEGGSPKKYSRDKEFIQQWIISVVLLVLMTNIINLIVGFCYAVTQIADNNKVEDDRITIYVKDVSVGGVELTSGNKGNHSFNKNGVLHWPVEADNYISSHFGWRDLSGDGVLDNFHKGIDIAGGGIADAEITAIGDGTVSIVRTGCTHNYGKDGSCGCNGDYGNWVEIDHGDGVTSTYAHCHEVFVEEGQSVSAGTPIGNVGSTGWSTGMHLHFEVVVDGEYTDPETYKYDGGPLNENGNGGGTSTGKKKTSRNNTRKVSYAFETNVEGMLMFQSQYLWQEFGLSNFCCLVVGAIITVFKGALYLLFGARMLAIALFTLTAPIVVLINGFLKINGNKGILTNWLKLFIFIALIKPIIGILYYILARSNVYVVGAHPLYMLIVIVIMVVVMIFVTNRFIRSFRQTSKESTVSRNADDSYTADEDNSYMDYVYADEDGTVTKIEGDKIFITRQNSESKPKEYKNIAEPLVSVGFPVRRGDEIGLRKFE